MGLLEGFAPLQGPSQATPIHPLQKCVLKRCRCIFMPFQERDHLVENTPDIENKKPFDEDIHQ
jgi:hypothetical protein